MCGKILTPIPSRPFIPGVQGQIWSGLLSLATETDHKVVIKKLRERGAEPESKDEDDQTSLSRTAELGTRRL
jgi:hypothetical protein